MKESGLHTPIRRRRLYEEVEERLQQEIASGRLKTGDAIPSERELMQRFGVGRPAVREAVLALQRKGLLRVGAGERTRVSQPTMDAVVNGVSGPVSLMLANPEGVRHLQQARRFLECALARYAALQAKPADLVRLADRLAANRAALAHPHDFERTDLEFHFELALITANPIFSSLHQATVGWLAQQRTISLMQRGAMRTAYRFHESIYQAIAAHDADAAERHMAAHLESVETYYWRTAASSPAQSTSQSLSNE
jgi:GntR family transcriptional repressor for pyruvate dehydrogenase complex